MQTNSLLITGIFISGLSLAIFNNPSPASAEMYVAGQAGVNFADRINSIGGTGPQAGLPDSDPSPNPDFDLQNSITYGAKVGYFPGHSWYGIEGEVFHTSPHLKQIEFVPAEPGVYFRVTTVGANFIARYPGRTLQPYAGVGIGAAIAHVGNATTVRSDTDVATAWNVLAGLRAFITPKIAIFGEYKYTGATLKFEGAYGPDGGFSGNYRAQHILGGLSYHF